MKEKLCKVIPKYAENVNKNTVIEILQNCCKCRKYSKIKHLVRFDIMIKVLFICHGNICRSPMAEFIFKKMVSNAGISDKFYIASAAVSNEEHGNPVYPPCRKLLNEHGIDCSEKRAVQIKKSDYDKYDYIIAMEAYNLIGLKRIIGDDTENKVHLLLDYTENPGDIDDPWYSGEYVTAYNDIERGLKGFLNYIYSKDKDIRK